MREFHIECTIAALQHAWKHAVVADLGQQVTFKIDELIAELKALQNTQEVES